MKDVLIYALPAILLALLYGHQSAGGKYQSTTVSNIPAIIQTDTRTGATRLCVIEPVPSDQRVNGSINKVTSCGQWRGKQ